MRSATARTTGTLTALPSIAYRLARDFPHFPVDNSVSGKIIGKALQAFALHFRQHTDSGFLFFVRLSVKSFPGCRFIR